MVLCIYPHFNIIVLMPKRVGKFERGAVDYGNLFGLLFLVLTLGVITAVTANRGFSLNIGEKASLIGDSDGNGDYCAPKCGSNNCGNDGCGGSCGSCSDGNVCRAGVCTAPAPVVPPPANIPTTNTPKPGEFGYVYPGVLDNGLPYIAGTYVVNGKRYLVGTAGTAQAAFNYYKANPNQIVAANFSDKTKKELSLDAILLESQTAKIPTPTPSNIRQVSAYECVTLGGQYISTSRMCLVTTTTQSIGKRFEGDILYNTTILKDINSGTIIDSKTVEIDPATLRQVVATPVPIDALLNPTAIFTKPLDATCNFNTDCGSGKCGKKSIMSTGSTCLFNDSPTAPSTTADISCSAGTSKVCTGTLCNCLTPEQELFARNSNVINGGPLSLTSLVAPIDTTGLDLVALAASTTNYYTPGTTTKNIFGQTVHLTNYGYCEGDVTCNMLLTSAQHGLDVGTGGGFTNYTNAYAPDKVNFIWKLSGYSSEQECREDMGKTAGPLAAATCNNYVINKEQLISSVKLGVTLTTEAAALAAIPTIIGAGSVSGAVLATFRAAGAISTLSQTGNTAAICIESVDAECGKQTVYTALSWANLGTQDLVGKAFSKVPALINTARVANSVVSVANGYTDAVQFGETCLGNNGVETSAFGCGMSTAALLGDVVGGFFDLKSGQLIFGKPPKIPDVPSLPANTIANTVDAITPAETSLAANSLANNNPTATERFRNILTAPQNPLSLGPTDLLTVGSLGTNADLGRLDYLDLPTMAGKADPLANISQLDETVPFSPTELEDTANLLNPGEKIANLTESTADLNASNLTDQLSTSSFSPEQLATNQVLASNINGNIPETPLRTDTTLNQAAVDTSNEIKNVTQPDTNTTNQIANNQTTADLPSGPAPQGLFANLFGEPTVVISGITPAEPSKILGFIPQPTKIIATDIGGIPVRGEIDITLLHPHGSGYIPSTVDQLKAIMDQGGKLDPVKITEFEGKIYTYDGANRVTAMIQSGQTKIDYEFVPYSKLDEISKTLVKGASEKNIAGVPLKIPESYSSTEFGPSQLTPSTNRIRPIDQPKAPFTVATWWENLTKPKELSLAEQYKQARIETAMVANGIEGAEGQRSYFIPVMEEKRFRYMQAGLTSAEIEAIDKTLANRNGFQIWVDNVGALLFHGKDDFTYPKVSESTIADTTNVIPETPKVDTEVPTTTDAGLQNPKDMSPAERQKLIAEPIPDNLNSTELNKITNNKLAAAQAEIDSWDDGLYQIKNNDGDVDFVVQVETSSKGTRTVRTLNPNTGEIVDNFVSSDLLPSRFTNASTNEIGFTTFTSAERIGENDLAISPAIKQNQPVSKASVDLFLDGKAPVGYVLDGDIYRPKNVTEKVISFWDDRVVKTLDNLLFGERPISIDNNEIATAPKPQTPLSQRPEPAPELVAKLSETNHPKIMDSLIEHKRASATGSIDGVNVEFDGRMWSIDYNKTTPAYKEFAAAGGNPDALVRKIDSAARGSNEDFLFSAKERGELRDHISYPDLTNGRGTSFQRMKTFLDGNARIIISEELAKVGIIKAPEDLILSDYFWTSVGPETKIKVKKVGNALVQSVDRPIEGVLLSYGGEGVPASKIGGDHYNILEYTDSDSPDYVFDYQKKKVKIAANIVSKGDPIFSEPIQPSYTRRVVPTSDEINEVASTVNFDTSLTSKDIAKLVGPEQASKVGIDPIEIPLTDTPIIEIKTDIGNDGIIIPLGEKVDEIAADLTGFSTVTREAQSVKGVGSPEDLGIQKLRDRYFERIAQHAIDHNGRTTRFAGDGAEIIFLDGLTPQALRDIIDLNTSFKRDIANALNGIEGYDLDERAAAQFLEANFKDQLSVKVAAITDPKATITIHEGNGKGYIPIEVNTTGADDYLNTIKKYKYENGANAEVVSVSDELINKLSPAGLKKVGIEVLAHHPKYGTIIKILDKEPTFLERITNSIKNFFYPTPKIPEADVPNTTTTIEGIKIDPVKADTVKTQNQALTEVSSISNIPVKKLSQSDLITELGTSYEDAGSTARVFTINVDGEENVIRLFKPGYVEGMPGRGIDLKTELIRESNGAKVLSDLGIGPKFKGLVEFEDGKLIGYETSKAEGNFTDNMPPGTVNEQTVADLKDIHQKLTDSGYYQAEVQYFIDSNGRVTVIDAGTVYPLSELDIDKHNGYLKEADSINSDFIGWPRKTAEIPTPETGNYYLTRNLASGNLAPDLEPLKLHIREAADLINDSRYDEALRLMGTQSIADEFGVKLTFGETVNINPSYLNNMTDQGFAIVSDQIARTARYDLGVITKPVISGAIPDSVKREQSIVLLEEWIHALQDKNALANGIPVSILSNSDDIEREAAIILNDLEVLLSEPFMGRYDRTQLNIQGQNLESIEYIANIPPTSPTPQLSKPTLLENVTGGVKKFFNSPASEAVPALKIVKVAENAANIIDGANPTLLPKVQDWYTKNIQNETGLFPSLRPQPVPEIPKVIVNEKIPTFTQQEKNALAIKAIYELPSVPNDGIKLRESMDALIKAGIPEAELTAIDIRNAQLVATQRASGVPEAKAQIVDFVSSTKTSPRVTKTGFNPNISTSENQIQNIVAKMDTYLETSFSNGENIVGCRGGLCGTASEYGSLAADLTPDLKPKIYQLKDLNNKGRGIPLDDSFGHTILVVEDESGTKFLIDVTFNQFIDQRTEIVMQNNKVRNVVSGTSKGNPLVEKLLKDGYFELTDRSLTDYLNLTSSGNNKPSVTLDILNQVAPSITTSFTPEEYKRITPELLDLDTSHKITGDNSTKPETAPDSPSKPQVTIFGNKYEFNGFKNKDGKFTIWPFELTPTSKIISNWSVKINFDPQTPAKSTASNNELVNNFLNKIDDPIKKAAEQMIAEKVLEQHISHGQFVNTLENKTLPALSTLIGNEKYIVIIDKGRSNEWVFELAAKKLGNLPTNVFDNEIDALNFIKNNPDIAHIVLFDDGSYSGSQMFAHVTNLKNELPTNVQVNLAIPYMTTKAANILENQGANILPYQTMPSITELFNADEIKILNEGGINTDSPHLDSWVLTTFDHKIGDPKSTPNLQSRLVSNGGYIPDPVTPYGTTSTSPKNKTIIFGQYEFNGFQNADGKFTIWPFVKTKDVSRVQNEILLNSLQRPGKVIDIPKSASGSGPTSAIVFNLPKDGNILIYRGINDEASIFDQTANIIRYDPENPLLIDAVNNFANNPSPENLSFIRSATKNPELLANLDLLEIDINKYVSLGSNYKQAVLTANVFSNSGEIRPTNLSPYVSASTDVTQASRYTVDGETGGVLVLSVPKERLEYVNVREVAIKTGIQPDEVVAYIPYNNEGKDIPFVNDELEAAVTHINKVINTEEVVQPTFINKYFISKDGTLFPTLRSKPVPVSEIPATPEIKVTDTDLLAKKITGLSVNDPNIVARMEQDVIKTRTKYGLPPVELKNTDPKEYARQLIIRAQKSGVDIKPVSEFKTYLEKAEVVEGSLPSGVFLNPIEDAASGITRPTIALKPDFSINDLEHEFIHSQQFLTDNRSPIEIREYEAYIAGKTPEQLNREFYPNEFLTQQVGNSSLKHYQALGLETPDWVATTTPEAPGSTLFKTNTDQISSGNKNIDTVIGNVIKNSSPTGRGITLGASIVGVGLVFGVDYVSEHVFGVDLIKTDSVDNLWNNLMGLFTDNQVLPGSTGGKNIVNKEPQKTSTKVDAPISVAKTSREILEADMLGVTDHMKATTPEQLAALFASIGANDAYVGSDGSLICGPLSLEILKRLGIYTGNVNTFYLFNPETEWDKLLVAFPTDKFTITNTLAENHSIGDMQYWEDNPLKVGDFMYLQVAGNSLGFEHMLVVDLVDAQGRAYSTTNHFTTVNGVTTFVVDRVLLYDPTNPDNPNAMFNKWTDRSLLNVNGNTGSGGFLVIRPKPETVENTITGQVSSTKNSGNDANPNLIPNAEYTTNQFNQNFLYYNQFDYAGEMIKNTNLTWANEGCGIMVGAMVTNMNPYQYYGEFKENGNEISSRGTNFEQMSDTLEALGYTIIQIDKNEINNYTSQGNPVVVDTDNMLINGNRVPHFAEAIGVDDEGNYILNDPAQGPGVVVSDKEIDRVVDGEGTLVLYAIIKN